MRTLANTCNHIHWTSFAFSEVVVAFSSSRTHAPSLKFEFFMSTPWISACVRSLHFDPPLLFLALRSVPFPLPLNYLKSVVNVHNSCNESMDPTDEFSLCTGYETKAHDFDEFSVEPYVQLLDSPPLFSWKVSSSDLAYNDNALEDMLHQAHREQSYHSPREDFSVSLSSSMSTEEGVLLEIDWGDSVSTEAKIRTLLDNQKEQILAECQARSNQHEFQAARAEDEQQLLQWQILQQNVELREAHQRSLTKMEEWR